MLLIPQVTKENRRSVTGQLVRVLTQTLWESLRPLSCGLGWDKDPDSHCAERAKSV